MLSLLSLSVLPQMPVITGISKKPQSVIFSDVLFFHLKCVNGMRIVNANKDIGQS